jgi:hypothetical protein
MPPHDVGDRAGGGRRGEHGGRNGQLQEFQSRFHSQTHPDPQEAKMPIRRKQKMPVCASAALLEPRTAAFNRRRPGRSAQLTAAAALAQ